MSKGKAFQTLLESSPTLSVGILSADLLNLREEIEHLESTDLKLLHFDVMDGCFVPFLTTGPRLIKSIQTHLLKDIHLMINQSDTKILDYVDAGADILTVHMEACKDVLNVLRELETLENKNDPERGIIRSVAINPDIPLEQLEPLMDDLEMIVVLAVNPKIEGLPFDNTVEERFVRVKEMITQSGNNILTCIDGGVKLDNIDYFAQMGADILVSGSAIFKGSTPRDNIRFMLDKIKFHID